MPLNPIRRARIIVVTIVSAVGAVMYAGAAHADEGATWCAPTAAPAVLAKRPAAAISYAPRHPSIHRHHVPAILRKPAPEVGCTPESLTAAVSPLSVPAVGEATDPVVAEAIPPVAMATPLAAEAPAPVVAEAIPPVAMATPLAAEAPAPVVAEAIPPVAMATPLVAETSGPVIAEAIPPVAMETPQGAIAAAAAGAGPAIIPISALVAYIGVCVVGHACGGQSGTVGGQSLSTTGTTGTH